MNTSASTPHYDAHRADWLLAKRFFELSGIETYLTRARNEPKAAFQERKNAADARPYTRDLITRLSGALMNRYAESERSHPGVPSEWYGSAGAASESYPVLMTQLAEKLLLYNEAWLLLDSGLHVLSPLEVPSYDSTSALVAGKRRAGSVLEGYEAEKVYTHYRPEGFDVYSDEGDPLDSGTWSEEGYAYAGEEGPAAPVVRVQMPWSAQLGRAVAGAHRAIYRKEADLDASERNAAHSLLQVAAESEEDFQWATNQLKEGNVAIPYNPSLGEHSFLSPSMDQSDSIRSTLDWKIDQLYRTAYQELEGIQRQQTATEAALRDTTGAGAALSVLAEVLESAETSLLPLAAQSLDMSRGWEAAEATWPSRYDQVEVSLDPEEASTQETSEAE